MKKKHKRLLEEIESDAKYTASYTGRKKFDQRVMDAMAEVIRENFVSLQYLPFAYENGPLPIGYGQTISQPSGSHSREYCSGSGYGFGLSGCGTFTAG